jgi:uncharacterized protein involved in type VI secretion and phage assembly
MTPPRDTAFDATRHEAFLSEQLGRWYGVYPALVSDVRDDSGRGRVKVRLPWSPDGAGGAYEAWARLATLMGGPNRGTWFVPDVHDEVLVAFEAGDPRRPYVVGGLWNGVDDPPESMDGAGRNLRKVVRSRNGVKIVLDDTDGHEALILETPGGQRIALRDGPASIELTDANNNSVKLDASGITVTTTTKVTINAGPAAEITAASLTGNAGMSKFSGMVQATTVQTPTVISSIYMPGAGNIW